MNNNKHSTGEWIIRENLEADGISHLAIVSRARHLLGGEHMVCSVTPMEYRRPIDDANAKLLRAAPKLLEALTKIAEMESYAGEVMQIVARDAIAEL